jgi:hypothetical protein
LDKCEFAKPIVKFLGQIIGSGLRQVDPAKIESINNICKPTNVKMLKSFLGMMSYHSHYIDHFAVIAKPLFDLTRVGKCKTLPWTDIHENAFVALKCKLSEVVALSVPRSPGLFILRTDASNFAVSGCLYQLCDDDIDKVCASGKDERPISFFSKKLSGSQINWSTIEKEAYAVVASLSKFEPIIFHSKIVIFCNHNPLSYLVDNATHSAKLSRWKMGLLQYDYEFRYIKGVTNVVADFFSRCDFQ